MNAVRTWLLPAVALLVGYLSSRTVTVRRSGSAIAVVVACDPTKPGRCVGPPASSGGGLLSVTIPEGFTWTNPTWAPINEK